MQIKYYVNNSKSGNVRKTVNVPVIYSSGCIDPKTNHCNMTDETICKYYATHHSRLII